MADNTVLNAGSGGDTFRTLEDGSSIKWPAGVTAFATTVGTPDVLAIVTPTTGLPVRLADGSGYLATLPVSVAATLTVTGAGGSFPVTDSGGSLTVDGTVAFSNTTIAVTNVGTFAVQAAQSGTWTVTGAGGTFPVTGTFWQATQPVSAASLPLPSGAATESTLATVAASLDTLNSTFLSPIQVFNNGTFAVQAEQSGAWSVAVSGTVTVGSHAVTNAGTFAVQVSSALPAGTNNIGDVDVLSLPALPTGSNVIGAVTQSGTWNVGTVTTVTGVTTVSTVTAVTTLTGGGVAHDGADSGNPVKVGARAASTLSDDTMVANGDRTDNVSDLDGALIVRQSHPLGDLISERVTDTGGTSTGFTNFGATASTRNVVTGYSVYNASATPGYVDFRDGTAGSVLWTVPLPAGGGANFCIPQGIFKTTANTALAFDVSAALTTVYISVTGFKSKV